MLLIVAVTFLLLIQIGLLVQQVQPYIIPDKIALKILLNFYVKTKLYLCCFSYTDCAYWKFFAK